MDIQNYEILINHLPKILLLTLYILRQMHCHSYLPSLSRRINVDKIIVNTGDEKEIAEKSPIGSLSIASKRQNSIAPPIKAWQKTFILIFQSSNWTKQLLLKKITGETVITWKMHLNKNIKTKIQGNE